VGALAAVEALVDVEDLADVEALAFVAEDASVVVAVVLVAAALVVLALVLAVLASVSVLFRIRKFAGKEYFVKKSAPVCTFASGAFLYNVYHIGQKIVHKLIVRK
jgi:hypothetical protein